MTTYIIDKRFTTSVQRTPRVLEIAEGFGLGLSDREFVVYDQFKIDLEPGDVIYITGQSGSGKSLLLRDLARQMSETMKVADLEKIELADRPVIELLGKTTTIAADYLAKAGISDAYLYLRRPSELSDGQRYRLRLALLMESGADVWVADEFGAVLDRITARVIAWNIQKTARALGKTLIVATTHTDLTEELSPSIIITKRFRDRIEAKRRIEAQRPGQECPGPCGEHVFSRAMNQARPRKCVNCGAEEIQ